jgi:hypothetical protein
MKILACGIERIKGTSKAGALFDMCNLHVLVPVENTSSAKVAIEGSGMKQMDIAADPAVIAQCAGLFTRGPAYVEVTTEARPNRGKMETTVVGVAAFKAAA